MFSCRRLSWLFCCFVRHVITYKGKFLHHNPEVLMTAVGGKFSRSVPPAQSGRSAGGHFSYQLTSPVDNPLCDAPNGPPACSWATSDIAVQKNLHLLPWYYCTVIVEKSTVGVTPLNCGASRGVRVCHQEHGQFRKAGDLESRPVLLQHSSFFRVRSERSQYSYSTWYEPSELHFCSIDVHTCTEQKQ